MSYMTAAIQTNKCFNTDHSIAQHSCNKDIAVQPQLTYETARMINYWHSGYYVDHEQQYHIQAALM